MSKDEYYEGDYGPIEEEDIEDEKNSINSYWGILSSSIEELYLSKVLPKNMYNKFLEINDGLCKHIGHVWELDQCNHLEHAGCGRCGINAKSIEHVKEMLVKFPFGRIGSMKTDNPIFQTFILNKDK